ncbi:MAG: hypothetical protein ACI8ZF_000315 [Candidatus Midichloriaceae bacterium]
MTHTITIDDQNVDLTDNQFSVFRCLSVVEQTFRTLTTLASIEPSTIHITVFKYLTPSERTFAVLGEVLLFSAIQIDYFASIPKELYTLSNLRFVRNIHEEEGIKQAINNILTHNKQLVFDKLSTAYDTAYLLREGGVIKTFSTDIILLISSFAADLSPALYNYNAPKAFLSIFQKISLKNQDILNEMPKISPQKQNILNKNFIIWNLNKDVFKNELCILQSLGVSLKKSEHLKQISQSNDNTNNKFHTSPILFKALDSGIDMYRAYQQPSLENIIKVAASYSHILSITMGFTKISVAANILSIAATYYTQEIHEAAKIIGVSTLFIASSYALSCNSYIDSYYKLGTFLLAARGLENNIRSLTNEIYDKNNTLKSAQAYYDIYQNIANSSNIQWFADKAEEYKEIIDAHILESETKPSVTDNTDL